MDFATTFGSSLPPKRRRILCAEDHAQMADVMRHVLERAGHEVVIVGDGRAAWDRVRSSPGYFDVVITDHQMPHLTGLELVANLRQIGFAGKIIVQSSDITVQEQAAFARLGIYQIVHKPSGLFDLPALI